MQIEDFLKRLISLKKYTLLFLLFLLIGIGGYLFSGVSSWVSAFSFNAVKVFSLLLIVPYMITRGVNVIVLFALGMFPLFSSVIIGIPSSFQAEFDFFPSGGIDQLAYKVNWLILNLLLVIILFLYAVSKQRTDLFETIQMLSLLKRRTKSLKAVTLIFNAITVIYLFSQIFGDLPMISYFSRVLFYALSWYFLIVGIFRSKLGKANYITSIILLFLHALIVFASGGRYSAIWLLILFFIGYYLSSSVIQRRFLRLQTIWAIPLAVFVVGSLGLIRQEIGRGGLKIVVEENRFELIASSMSDAFNKFLSDSDYRAAIYEEMSSRSKGGGALSRVVLYSPKKIAYRGWENLHVEVSSIFTIAALQGGGFDLSTLSSARSKQVEKGLSTAAANRYGFHVNEGHSVEWPILADGYSRFGMLGATIYVIIYILWFSLLFKFVSKVVKSPVVLLIFILTYTSIAYSSFASEPLYESVRTSILYSIPVTVISIAIVNLFPNKNVIHV